MRRQWYQTSGAIGTVAGWFLLLEVFPTTLSLAQKTHQVREILLGQRVLVGGHVGTAVFDLRYHSLIVDRLSRYQSGAFVKISQCGGSCSGCPRIVVVADPTFIEVNFFSPLGTALGKPLEIENLCRTLETAFGRIRRTARSGVLQAEH